MTTTYPTCVRQTYDPRDPYTLGNLQRRRRAALAEGAAALGAARALRELGCTNQAIDELGAAAAKRLEVQQLDRRIAIAEHNWATYGVPADVVMCKAFKLRSCGEQRIELDIDLLEVQHAIEAAQLRYAEAIANANATSRPEVRADWLDRAGKWRQSLSWQQERLAELQALAAA